MKNSIDFADLILNLSIFIIVIKEKKNVLISSFVYFLVLKSFSLWEVPVLGWCVGKTLYYMFPGYFFAACDG
jgi:hypothetical protein